MSHPYHPRTNSIVYCFIPIHRFAMQDFIVGVAGTLPWPQKCMLSCFPSKKSLLVTKGTLLIVRHISFADGLSKLRLYVTARLTSTRGRECRYLYLCQCLKVRNVYVLIVSDVVTFRVCFFRPLIIGLNLACTLTFSVQCFELFSNCLLSIS